jgi:hypothetical protein
MDNNLGNIIKNASARAWIYGIYVIVGLLIGGLKVWYQDPDPQWLTQAFDVWAYLSIPVGSLAALNSNIIPTRTVVTQNVEAVSADNVNIEPDPASGGPIESDEPIVHDHSDGR